MGLKVLFNLEFRMPELEKANLISNFDPKHAIVKYISRNFGELANIFIFQPI